MAKDVHLGGGYFTITADISELLRQIDRAKSIVRRGIKDMESEAVIGAGPEARARTSSVRAATERHGAIVEFDREREAEEIGRSLSKSLILSGTPSSFLSRGAAAVGGAASAIVGTSFGMAVNEGMKLADANRQLASATAKMGISFQEASKFAEGLYERISDMIPVTEAETKSVVALGLFSNMTFSQIEERARASATLAQSGLREWREYFNEFIKARTTGGANFGLISLTTPGMPEGVVESIALKTAEDIRWQNRIISDLPQERIRRAWRGIKTTFGRLGMEVVTGALDVWDIASSGADAAGSWMVEKRLESELGRRKERLEKSVRPPERAFEFREFGAPESPFSGREFSEISGDGNVARRSPDLFAVPSENSFAPAAPLIKSERDAEPISPVPAPTGLEQVEPVLEELRRIFQPLVDMGRIMMRRENEVTPMGTKPVIW